MPWYQETAERLYALLESSPQGLTKKEAAARLKKFGPNQLALKKEPLWRIIIEPFRNVFVAVLGLAAFISLLSHERLDAGIIAVIIIVNACIYYSQQYATTRVLRSLKKHSVQEVNILREGQEQKVDAVMLVPGDIIVLSEGERVPADARVIQVENLQVNESSLTGESVPVHKHASRLETEKQLYEQDNMVFQGTYVLTGTAIALVVETGGTTEFGKIAALASDQPSKSPVQAKIDQLITLLIKVIAVLASFVFILSLMRGIPSGEALRFVLSLTVSAVPEGLPVALTVIIVLGMRRMARQKALVRNFKAIEDIGLVTTIATDKTGTLTKNHLRAVDSWSFGKDDVLKLAGKTIDADGVLSDPLDKAISEASPHHAVNKVYPFDLGLRMSGAFVAADETIYIKGWPEHILSRSKVTQTERQAAESVMHGFAAKGYRVIAFGRRAEIAEPPKTLASLAKETLQFVGYIAFADELRPEAAPAVRAAHAAGIRVRLITGDHYETAFNIGRQVGIAEREEEVIQGADLPGPIHELAAVVKNKTVFARILPEDKFRILKALKETEITAMTGDGVNDVPALANAHVGIAMGSGSDIARDAGGIVLLNDNFATIIKAVAEGRKIFDNIRRMLFYLLSTSLGEVLTMIGALLFGLPLPVTAIQILWINLVTDTALVLPLGLEPEEDGHMKRPPRRPKDPLLSRMLLGRMGIVAFTMALITLCEVFILRRRGYTTDQIQTVAFMSLIAAQWTNAFNARSEFKSSFSRIKKVNRGMIVGFLIAFTLQMIVMFGPLGSVFNIQTVPFMTLLVCAGTMALSVMAVAEVHKAVLAWLKSLRTSAGPV